MIHTSSAEAFLAGVSEQERKQFYCLSNRTKIANDTYGSLHNFAITENGDIDFYCTYLKLEKLKRLPGQTFSLDVLRTAIEWSSACYNQDAITLVEFV